MNAKSTKAEKRDVKRYVLRELGEVRSGWFDNMGPNHEHETRRRLYAQRLLTVAMRAVKAAAIR